MTPKHFSFNSPYGACPACSGLGQRPVFDDGLMVGDPEKSLEQGVILPWTKGGARMVADLPQLARDLDARLTGFQRLISDLRRASRAAG